MLWRVLLRLSEAEHAPLELSGPRPRNGDTWQTVARLTATGRELLQGRADHVALNGLNRWVGGVELRGREPAVRWDEARREIVHANNPHLLQ